MPDAKAIARILADVLSPQFFTRKPGWQLPPDCWWSRDLTPETFLLIAGEQKAAEGLAIDKPADDVFLELSSDYNFWLENSYGSVTTEDARLKILADAVDRLHYEKPGWSLDGESDNPLELHQCMVHMILDSITFEYSLDGNTGVFAERFVQVLMAGGMVVGAHAPENVPMEGEDWCFGDPNQARLLVFWPHEEEPTFGDFPGWPWNV